MGLRIYILGAGGLGSLVGACLAEAGASVTLVGRAAHVEAIRERGLRVSGIRGERSVRKGIEATTSAREAQGPFDLLVLCVKARDTAAALDSAESLRERTRLALSLQNTIEKEQVLADWIGRERVVGCSTTEAGTLEGPGQVRHVATAPTAFYFGVLEGGPSERHVTTLVDAFSEAGFHSRSAADIEHVEWEKLLQISTLATWSVSTMGLMPGGSVAEALVIREAAEHYVAIAHELLAVYRALGYEPQDFFRPFSRFRALASESFEEAVVGTQAEGQRMLDEGVIGRPSLHVDLLRGKPTEVEYCLAPFLSEADRLGLAVPSARAGYRIIRSLEQMLT